MEAVLLGREGALHLCSRLEIAREHLLPTEGEEDNRVLTRVFYQSAHCAVLSHERSRAYHRRKRSEGMGHTQAVISLARRRVNVLWAMLQNVSTFETALRLDILIEILSRRWVNNGEKNTSGIIPARSLRAVVMLDIARTTV